MNRNISKTTYKVSDFLSWQRSDSLILSPSFQRRPVWPKGAKSLLIDTVVQGLPMPIVFLRERTDLQTLEPMREVVDGQQRLRTLISFIEPKLLSDFDSEKDSFVVKKGHNEDLAGKTFRQLDDSDRKRILAYDFSVHVLPSDTEDSEVLQIFARMNSTGVKLKPQELRNAKYYGVFKRSCYNLAYEQLQHWRNWEIFSENDIARMDEVEATSDLLRLMIEGIQSKSQPALDRLYKRYDEDFPHASEVAKRFRVVMDRINESVGDILPITEFSRRTLFETLFAFFYDLTYGIGSPLKRQQPNTMPIGVRRTVERASDAIAHGELSEEQAKVLRGGTGNKESRIVRLKFLKSKQYRGKA